MKDGVCVVENVLRAKGLLKVSLTVCDKIKLQRLSETALMNSRLRFTRRLPPSSCISPAAG